jgi:hypothetical protein
MARHVVTLAVVALAAGCGTTAQVVKRDDGGVIALRDSFGNPVIEAGREKAMEDAQKKMAEHCGGPKAFKITEEGETVVGSKGTTSGSAYNVGGGVGIGSAYNEATDKREWRVAYKCLPGKRSVRAGTPAKSGEGESKRRKKKKPVEEDDD